ncbi:paired amphipathic helix protein Sin3-like 3 [Salvia miltiorrhiza]|uniref:paired amphipathic helix protein Sin3-like 3 n=1 Tax=Salvia miltiorrhiza TaxID=226208 RepID=UPI0025AD1162|nr:paired amphipathic helix protein Sin3-like 3 [Salvia miltiorrhiza]
MAPLLSTALQYIREVKSTTAAADDGGQIYGEFLQTLKQYRKRNLDSSIVTSTVQTLFRSHPNLLDGFNLYAPAAAAAAATAAAGENSGREFLNRVRLRSCADFLNRAGARFDGGGAYRKFLECMHAYSRGEIAAEAVADEVAGIFGRNNGDLVREFARFLPEQKLQTQPASAGEEEASRKRKREIAGTDKPGTKKRRDPISFAVPAWRGREQRGSDEEEAAKRDYEMEDSLFEIDVRIGRLTSAGISAANLHRGISDGGVPPAGIRIDEHFTVLDLICIRSVGRKLPDYAYHCRDLVPVLVELVEVLGEKKLELLGEREKIGQKWKRIRQSQ